MILNIYKIFDFDLKLFKNKPNEINITNEKNNQIEGKINLDKFSNNFFIDLKSNLLFIISNKKSQIRKVVKYLNSILPGRLTYFLPTATEEHEFLCSNDIDVDYLKFIHNNKIVDNKNLTKKYCKNELEEDYYFFEAKIKLENDSNCYFLYYGDVIKIKDKFSQYLNEIIELFVKFWVVE